MFVSSPRISSFFALPCRPTRARCRRHTRAHNESDLHVFLRWCAEHDLDPLAVDPV